jgi:hypothetical protein
MYWLSTLSPATMLDKPIDRHMSDYLKDNLGIDAAMLAIDLGVHQQHIESMQRRLKLRPISTWKGRK